MHTINAEVNCPMEKEIKVIIMCIYNHLLVAEVANTSSSNDVGVFSFFIHSTNMFTPLEFCFSSFVLSVVIT